MTYSALRLGLLAACFALGYWAGLRTWLLLAVAVLAAWALSYVGLGAQRDAAAGYLAQRAAARRRDARAAADEDAAHEDALDESARRRASGGAAGARGHTDVPAPGDGAAARGYPGETASPRPNSTP